MNSQDIVNILLILLLVIITACTAYTAYYFVQALKSITDLADNLNDTTQNIKEKIQLKALAVVPALLVALVSKIMRKKK